MKIITNVIVMAAPHKTSKVLPIALLLTYIW